MKLDAVRLGCALATLWGAIVFLVGVANLIFGGYGASLLKAIDSIYPGYHYGEWGFLGVLVATIYAIIDGWVVGAVFGWLYNLYTKRKRTAAE
ncbi:MAG TPA: hypothetical protein ENF17_03660 [Candidatus Aminicenantes bacterium]|nr:hypothetical protein [Candidatus Aminicenantes bacterium]